MTITTSKLNTPVFPLEIYFVSGCYYACDVNLSCQTYIDIFC